MYDSGYSHNLDVAMAHPFSKDAVTKTAQKGGFTAARRDEGKHVKYDRQHPPGTFSAMTVTPPVLNIL